MSIINTIETIKKIHPKDIAIVKIGKFNYTYGKDAYILAYLFQYKLTKLENTNVCAFPVLTNKKVLSKLEEKRINYVLIDKRNNYDIDDISDNKNLNQYEIIFEKAKEYVK